REPIMRPAGDALAVLAAQHADQMHGAKALAGAVDGGQRLARSVRRIPGLRRVDAGVAVAAGPARLAEIIEQPHTPASGRLAQAEQDVELRRGYPLVFFTGFGKLDQ